MSFLASIFAPGEAARSDELDARLRALNAAALARGKITSEQFEKTEERISAGGSSTYDEQLADALATGAEEGLANMQDGFRRAVNSTARGALGFIPAWVFIVGALWLARELGVFDWLREWWRSRKP